jgi:ribose transport system substrate-binding protein
MATAAGYGLIGKAAPPFVIAPVITVTKANVIAAYQEALHRDAPKSVVDAAK